LLVGITTPFTAKSSEIREPQRFRPQQAVLVYKSGGIGNDTAAMMNFPSLFILIPSPQTPSTEAAHINKPKKYA
jgi:hypothetical protein